MPAARPRFSILRALAVACLGTAAAAQPPPSAPAMPVEVAPRALSRIVTPAAGNAVKFTDRGEVRVPLHAGGGALMLGVQDTGIGEAFLPLLFEASAQDSEGHSRAFGGTGHGLAITKRLVDGMGGRIRVQSQRGAGSVFDITLPAPPSPPASDTHLATPLRAVVPA